MILYKSVQVSYETEVEVDIHLEDFDDDDLVEELRDRGYSVDVGESSDSFVAVRQLISEIHQKRRTGVEYQKDLDILIFDTIGRIA